MKNFFGVVPGARLRLAKESAARPGIAESILDLNATIRPHLAIVDTVTAMEGDGPLMGKPRHVGCLAMGADVVATDATCAGIMGLNPEKIPCRPLTSWSNSAKCVSRLTDLVVAVRARLLILSSDLQ